LIMRIEDVVSFVGASVPFKYYANDFPRKSEDNCGFVRVEGGSPPDKYIIGITSPSIQIVIRHKSGKEAERISHDVWNFFHGKEHFMIGDSKVKFASCDQSEPIYIGVDNNERTIYSVNVTCKVIE
jgi:hypothetical protein